MYKKFDKLSLPKSVEINGTRYEFNSDYRTILKLFKVLNTDQSELLMQEIYYVCIKVFYIGEIKATDYNEAIECMMLFLCGGEKEEETVKQPQLVDWDKDIDKIIAPISKSIGQDIRGLEYMHWWSFLGEYMEIGECRFSTIVSIRNKLAKKEKLADWEKKYYKEHKEEIDIVSKEDKEVNDYLKSLMKMNNNAIRKDI